MSKIIITYDDDCEMLSICNDKGSIFYGNYWDMNRDGKSLAKLFKKIGIDAEAIEKDFDDWD